jgi:adenylate cyclase
VFPHKGKPASPEEIGRSLAVSYLVEGSVRQTGDRVRVTAELVDMRDGRVLWSVRLDEALADVFAMQDSITAQIVGALAVRVTQIEQRRVLTKPTENLEAYDFVLRARPALQSPSGQTMWRRARCSYAPSSSTRITRPPTQRSETPIT